MEQCNRCIFYDKDYDELRQSGVDLIIPNAPKEQHFCRQYENHIDNDIVNDKNKCKYFTD